MPLLPTSQCLRRVRECGPVKSEACVSKSCTTTATILTYMCGDQPRRPIRVHEGWCWTEWECGPCRNLSRVPDCWAAPLLNTISYLLTGQGTRGQAIPCTGYPVLT